MKGLMAIGSCIIVFPIEKSASIRQYKKTMKEVTMKRIDIEQVMHFTISEVKPSSKITYPEIPQQLWLQT